VNKSSAHVVCLKSAHLHDVFQCLLVRFDDAGKAARFDRHVRQRRALVHRPVLQIFASEYLQNWPMDERATLTNMSVEAGGFTGIIEPDEQTLEYIVKMRGLEADDVRRGFVY